MNSPLAGILVADLTQNVAGPTCTQILGDLGAEVVKRLIGRADVLVQSLRAGVIEELGLDWERARAINPRLVYCSITAFGTEGPLAERPGYDPLMQALGGIMSINGHPGQPPARVPVSIVDMGTGMWAVIAIMGALRERDRTGRGVNVTTALYETALAWSVLQMNQFLGAGEVPLPQGSGTAMICPYEAFPTRDAWVMIAAASDALFTKACEALGVPGMPRDPRFRDNPSRVAHRNDVFESVSAVTRNFASTEVLERLQRAGVPCAPILPLDKVAAEPQTLASGMLVPAKHPRLPDYRAVGLPIRWDGERPPVARVPPLLGEHTAEVLGELGYDTAAIQELASRHVVQL